MGPFDRFNDRAKRVLALAQDEAIRFGHNYIGTEHLLLGLVREGDSVAARVLGALGIELSKVRVAVEYTVGRVTDADPPSEITLSPRTKKVIELAIDESRKLGHSHVGPEHLLLGIVREGEGIASGVLESLGVTLESIRHQVIATLGQQHAPIGAGMAVERSPDPRGSLSDAQGKKRDWYCEDVLSGKLEVKHLYEDELVLAFHHPYPEYEIHAVIIPKKHIASLMADEAADPELLRAMIRAVQAVARSIGLHEQGFRTQANAGAPGVTPHMHWHVIGPGLPPPRRAARGASAAAVVAARSGAATTIPRGRGPFDSLTDLAKRTLALAQDEAIRMRHNWIGTEHLLLGILRSSTVSAEILGVAGLDLPSARTAVAGIVPPGAEGPEIGEVTLTPRVKRVIELATGESYGTPGRRVSPEHLLVALIDEGGGVALGILSSLGKTAEVRAGVMRWLEGPSE